MKHFNLKMLGLALIIAFAFSACGGDVISPGGGWETQEDDPAPPPDNAHGYHVPDSHEGAPILGAGGTLLEPAEGTCYALPMSSYMITGYHHGSIVKASVLHAGDDINGGPGDPVYIIHDGEVITARPVGSWGGYVEIMHTMPDGTTFVSQYGHLDPTTIELYEGQRVTAGQFIGKLGDRSVNGGWPPHLHFAIYTGIYPSYGVLKGHVPSAEFSGYTDPIPFLDATLTGANCPASPPDACDVTCEDLQVDCGRVFACGDTPLDCGVCGAGYVCDTTNRCVADPPMTCTPRVDRRCDGDVVRWVDSCGVVEPGAPLETCEHGCFGGACEAAPSPMCTPRTCASASAECGELSDGCGGRLDCGACASGMLCEQNACVCQPHASLACHNGHLHHRDSCGQIEERAEVCSDGCEAARCLSCEEVCVPGTPSTRDPVGDEAYGGGQVLELELVDIPSCGVIRMKVSKADSSSLGPGEYHLRIGSARHWGVVRETVHLSSSTHSFIVETDHRGSLHELKEFVMTKRAQTSSPMAVHDSWWWSNYIIISKEEECY